jgi:hypothetical protein
MLVDEKRRQTDPLSPRSQPGDCACRSSASAATIDAGSRPHSGQAIKSRMHCGVGVMRVSCHDMPAEQAEAPQHEFITRCWPSQEKAQPLDQLRRSRGPSSRDLTSGPAHLLPLPPSLAPLVRLPSTPASRDQLVTFQARSGRPPPHSEAMGHRKLHLAAQPGDPNLPHFIPRARSDMPRSRSGPVRMIPTSRVRSQPSRAHVGRTVPTSRVNPATQG